MAIEQMTSWASSSGHIEFSKMTDSHLLLTISYLRKTYGEQPWHKRPAWFYLVETARDRGLIPDDDKLLPS